MRKSFQDRFWEQVNKTEGCWVYTGRKAVSGYGEFNATKLGTKLAHRVAWLLSGNTLQTGLVLDHMCRNRACVNPGHLREVTRRINALENSNSPSAKNANKTECYRGHPLAEENLIQGNTRKSVRMCKECHRANRIKSYRREANTAYMRSYRAALKKKVSHD